MMEIFIAPRAQVLKPLKLNKMKKLQILMFILSSVVVLSACKKGEDDKFLSLKSRKARLAGEWNIRSISGSSKNVSGSGTETITYNYNNGVLSTNTDGDIETKGFSLVYNFDKKGTYEIISNESSVGYQYSSTSIGNWTFLGKSKEAERKNKEFVSLFETSFQSSGTQGLFSSSSKMLSEIDNLELVRLTNKEMVVRLVSNFTQTDGSINSDLTEITFTFEKQ